VLVLPIKYIQSSPTPKYSKIPNITIRDKTKNITNSITYPPIKKIVLQLKVKLILIILMKLLT